MDLNYEPEISEFLLTGKAIPALLKILYKKLDYLKQQPLAPPHCYLEIIDQKYARWRGHNFTFSNGKKTYYIGKINSSAYAIAQQMLHNRQQLDLVKKRITQLEKSQCQSHRHRKD